jgi:hypothetical protein
MTHLRISRGARALGAAALLTFALAATAAAGNTEKFKLNTADNEAARAVTLTAADVGPGRTQLAMKPDLTADDTHCPNFNPKSSDLVVTGAAATKFDQAGARVQSEVELMRTPKMVQRDWQRSVSSPNFLPCLRSMFKKQSSAKARFVSFRRLQLPQVAPYSAGYRYVADITTTSGKIRMAVDILVFGRGRTEITLSTTMPVTSVSALFPNEIVWAKALARRIPA